MKLIFNISGKLKGFTFAELLVVLALTSLSITASYTSLNHIQKLFIDFKKQNSFLTQYIQLKKLLKREEITASSISEEKENEFIIERDSSKTVLKIREKDITLTTRNGCDTFHFEAKHLKKEYETMMNPFWKNKILKTLKFDVIYRNCIFHFVFQNQSGSNSKLDLEIQV